MRSTDKAYGSLAYDDAQLLRVPLCVSIAFLVVPGLGVDLTLMASGLGLWRQKFTANTTMILITYTVFTLTFCFVLVGYFKL